MTSPEKFSLLVNFQRKRAKVKITTTKHDVYRCKLLGQCEDSEGWAYEFYSPDYPTKFFALNCASIEHIEEISEDEWQAAWHKKNSPKIRGAE